MLIFGHAGIKGNECADLLAGTAIVTDGKSMVRVDIRSALGDQAHVENLHKCTIIAMHNHCQKYGKYKSRSAWLAQKTIAQIIIDYSTNMEQVS